MEAKDALLVVILEYSEEEETLSNCPVFFNFFETCQEALSTTRIIVLFSVSCAFINFSNTISIVCMFNVGMIKNSLSPEPG